MSWRNRIIKINSYVRRNTWRLFVFGGLVGVLYAGLEHRHTVFMEQEKSVARFLEAPEGSIYITRMYGQGRDLAIKTRGAVIVGTSKGKFFDECYSAPTPTDSSKGITSGLSFLYSTEYIFFPGHTGYEQARILFLQLIVAQKQKVIERSDEMRGWENAVEAAKR